MATKKNPTQTTLNHTLAGVSALLPGDSHTSLSKSSSSASLSEGEDVAQALLQLSIALIDSAIDILEKHLRRDGQLQHESGLMPGGTPGKHFRHVIETYRAFILPLQPYAPDLPPGPVQINYDAILPSTRRPIARNLSHCRKAMREIKNDLKAWGGRCTHASGDGGSALGEEMGREVVLTAITPTRQEMASSVGRELWFCSLHAIHHFSMLRTIAVHELGLDLPVEFGTAPSTILYRKNSWRPPSEKKEVRVVKSKL